jgi:hypothetical protein
VAAVIALAAYFGGWLALGSYELTRIPGDGIAVLAVTTAIAVGLMLLICFGSRPAPVITSSITWLAVCGVLLIVPLTFPVGVVSAWFLITGVFDPPHSLLLAMHLARGPRTALALGFLVVLPLVAGCLFLSLGARQHPPSRTAAGI